MNTTSIENVINIANLTEKELELMIGGSVNPDRLEEYILAKAQDEAEYEQRQ